MRQLLQRLRGKSEARDECTVVPIKDLADCHSLFRREFAIVVKYSLTCSFSLQKFAEIVDFFDGHPQFTILALPVQTARAASNLVAEYTGVHHETPQVLALRKGVVITHASCSRITEKFLTEIADMQTA